MGNLIVFGFNSVNSVDRQRLCGVFIFEERRRDGSLFGEGVCVWVGKFYRVKIFKISTCHRLRIFQQLNCEILILLPSDKCFFRY